ncbi:MAG: YvcK family protein [Clostridiales bacterium]|nr:YvcK family protein [Clostridiales bacterium]
MESYFYRSGRAPRVACIGGGTGLSVMLRGLKHRTPNITAIVAVTDDGGGSGVLRDELGMLPPGDIRNCILALSNIEPTMEKLIDYRFTSGSLAGQSFGNLLLAAMNGISESFDKAVARMGEVLAITGRVLPVTNADVRLLAEFEDGGVVIGESKIAQAKRERNCRIRRIRLVPEPVSALPESIRAIEEADIIVIGPGSLYTSLIPNLLVGGIAEAIERSRALKIYVANIMTQPGETEGYTLSDHIFQLFAHSSARLFDTCIVNSQPAPPEILMRYALEGAYEIELDLERVRALGVRVVEAFVADHRSGLVRHHPDRLAEQIMRIYAER